MSTVNSTQEDQAVSIMKAASIANVHISTIYKLRSKLGAFKIDDVWHIPVDSLQAYVKERADHAQKILKHSPVSLDGGWKAWPLGQFLETDFSNLPE